MEKKGGKAPKASLSRPCMPCSAAPTSGRKHIAYWPFKTRGEDPTRENHSRFCIIKGIFQCFFFFSDFVHIALNTTNSCTIEMKSSIGTNNKKNNNKKTKRINKYTVSIFQCVCGWWSRSRARWQSPRVERREEESLLACLLLLVSCPHK